jgi:hypothetical protein
MMAMTTSISTRVKPFLLVSFFITKYLSIKIFVFPAKREGCIPTAVGCGGRE